MAEKAKVVSKKMTKEDADRLVAVLTAAGVEGIEKIKDNGTFTVKFIDPDE